MSKVTIYTDGACYPNPGTGGWAAILQYVNNDGSLHEKEIFGSENNTTNNKMEIKAALESLKTLKYPCAVIIYTDSKYIKNSLGRWKGGRPDKKRSGWIVRWEKNKWKRTNNEPLLNKGIWKEMISEARRHLSIDIRFIKGHSGDILNERCDSLAVEARKKLEEHNDIQRQT